MCLLWVNQALEVQHLYSRKISWAGTELLFPNLSDVPLVKVCICLEMFNLVIVLYMSTEVQYLIFLEHQLSFFVFVVVFPECNSTIRSGKLK